MKRSFLSPGALVLALGLALMSFAQNANAVSVFSESISDDQPFDLFNVNFTRTRTDSTGVTVETLDAAIIADNQIDSDFGIYNLNDVSYRHNLSWINPAAGNFLTAELKIESFGVDGGNEVVLADTISLGSLQNDGFLLLEGFSTSIFASNSSTFLNLLFSDGFLNIVVDKNSGARGLGLLDSSSVFRSTLTVSYEAVPEPGTILLLASGLAGVAYRRRQAKS